MKRQQLKKGRMEMEDVGNTKKSKNTG